MEGSMQDNALRQQCLSIPELCAEQIEGVRAGFAESGLEKELKPVTRVILTGCGDSYFAACAAVPAFQKFVGAFGLSFEARHCLEVARFMDYPDRDNTNILVVGISASGRPARVCEALGRAKKHGCKTLALTNNADAPAAQTASHCFVVHTPPFPAASPGLRNYFGSLCGLFMLAAQLGRCKGMFPEERVEDMLEAMRRLAADYETVLPDIDERMFSLAQAWKDIRSIETVGDANAYPTAAFIAAKFVEAAGLFSGTTDTEEWCHVNFFMRNAAQIGLIVVADRNAPDTQRIREMLAQAAGIERPILLISNGVALEGAGVRHVVLPQAPAGYEFLEPMFNFLPGALLASYDSALRGETYFRGGRWSEPGINTIQTSRIEIV